AKVGAVRALQRPLVASEVAEDAAWDTSQGVDRRIIRVEADEDSLAFRHGPDLADEVGVVVPQFLLAVDASVGQFALVGLLVPVALRAREVQSSRLDAPSTPGGTGAPDAVGHVGIGVVADPGRPQVAEEGAELCDLLVAAR